MPHLVCTPELEPQVSAMHLEPDDSCEDDLDFAEQNRLLNEIRRALREDTDFLAVVGLRVQFIQPSGEPSLGVPPWLGIVHELSPQRRPDAIEQMLDTARAVAAPILAHGAPHEA